MIVALRNAELDRAAHAKFTALTEGPIIVHTSADSFLDWDLLQRDTRSRSLATLDPRTGAIKTLLPQGRLSSYRVARDGSFLTIMEDVTAKTDYDVIGGTDNTLKYVDTKTGETKVIAEAKDLKGVTLRWADDGRTFAFAKKGEVFVQGVDGGKPRSLTPKPPKPEGDAAKPEVAAADDKKKDE